MLLLNQDFVGHGGKRSHSMQWILDLEDGKSSIGACCEQILIVVTDTDACDHLRVSLNFKETI